MTNPIYSRVLFYLNARLRLNYNHLKLRERGGMISTEKSTELLRKDWLGKNLRYSRVKFNCWKRIYSGGSWSINPLIFLDLLWSRGRAGRLCTMLFISDHTSSRSKWDNSRASWRGNRGNTLCRTLPRWMATVCKSEEDIYICLFSFIYHLIFATLIFHFIMIH